MNDLLRTISENASEDLRKLIEEGADDILKAIHKTEEEAQANETKPKFSLGFKITVDFDAAAYACDLSWTLKQTLGTTHSIDDPNQGKLQIDPDDESVPFEKRADAFIQQAVADANKKNGTNIKLRKNVRI